MAKDRSNKHGSLNCFEKIFRAIFGGSRRRKTDVSIQNTNPSPPQKHVSSFVPLDMKTYKHFVNLPSSSSVEESRDFGQRAFCEEKFTSYIDGVKMRLRSCSDVVGVETSVDSRCEPYDSFNERVSGFIMSSKLKLIATPTPSMGYES